MAARAGWYWQLNVIRFFSTAPGAGWNGPFPTRAAATAADNGTSGIGGGTGGVGGGVGPGGTGPWWFNTATGDILQELQSPGAHWVKEPSENAAIAAATKWADDHITNTLLPGVSSTPGAGTNWGQLVIRIGEAVLGIVLIAVGLARITGAQNAVSAIAKARIP